MNIFKINQNSPDTINGSKNKHDLELSVSANEPFKYCLSNNSVHDIVK